MLVKILDNTRSTHAFFAQKVVLVEGDTDRYFFNAAFKRVYPELAQEISVLYIGGKHNYTKWKDFFEKYGLSVYYIGDLDNVFEFGLVDLKEKDLKFLLMQEKLNKLTKDQKEELRKKYNNLIADKDFIESPKRVTWKSLTNYFNEIVKIEGGEKFFKLRELDTNLETKIDEKYKDKVFFLKKGSIEDYCWSIKHGDLKGMINFCEESLRDLLDSTSEEGKEIKNIIEVIVGCEVKAKN